MHKRATVVRLARQHRELRALSDSQRVFIRGGSDLREIVSLDHRAALKPLITIARFQAPKEVPPPTRDFAGSLSLSVPAADSRVFTCTRGGMCRYGHVSARTYVGRDTMASLGRAGRQVVTLTQPIRHPRGWPNCWHTFLSDLYYSVPFCSVPFLTTCRGRPSILTRPPTR